MGKRDNLFLIGPMGSGKTAVGKQLARDLGMAFHDTDAEIERRTGVDIPFIFEKEGEAGFREREKEALARLAKLEHVVVATGGGAVLSAENRAVLKENGVVIYLYASVDEQLKRTSRSQNRPLLQTADPRAVLENLMKVRRPLYEETADICMDTSGRQVGAVADALRALLAERGLEALKKQRRLATLHGVNGVRTLTVQLGERSYPIHIGPGVLGNAGIVGSAVDAEQVLVVTNDVVAPLYLERLRGALGGRRVETLVLPDGEQHKTLATFERIIDRLIECRFHRDACIVALGGGVVGDVAGFAAASYQRGIAFVQAPTTLLAQVDSSVGGKTAVNHAAAKNMIGAFHQPAAVLTDTDTLKTLPRRELAAGLAEVVKYGLILDAEFLAWLESNIDELLALAPGAISHAIARSCEIKARIVAEDERERGSRALLNLGHTFGHALEAIGGYERWLHGEAVAIGMVLAARTSEALGHLDAEDCRRVEALLQRAGLPTRAPGVDVDALLERMALDKKASRKGLKLVLLERLGKATVAAAPDASLLRRVAAAGLADP